MLSWLRKNTHNLTLWHKATLGSIIGHTLIFMSMMFVYQDPGAHLSLTINANMLNNAIEYIVLPAPVIQKTAAAKPASKPQSAPALKPAAPKTAIAKSTPIAKPVEKKEPAKATPKKEIPKAIDKKVEKPVEKKETPKPKAEPKAQPKEPAADIPQALTAEEEQIAKMAEELGFHEKALLKEYVTLHQDIVSQWSPPPGMITTAACQITMTINWKGVLCKVHVDKSSGLPIYDISAQAAIENITMPRWTWGKTLTITFNQ